MTTGILPAIYLQERFYAVAAQLKKPRCGEISGKPITNRPFRMLVASTLFFGFASTLSSGIGFFPCACIGWLVVWCGFKIASAAQQAPGVFHSMRLTYGLLPATCLGLALLALTRYPLSPVRIQQLRRDLEARRGRM